jgi:protein-tyrosine-phosphatase
MVEFKYRRSDSTAVLMEVNGRFWGSLSVSMQSGLNFPLYAWQLAHHEQPKVPSQYRIGLRVRWMKGELHRLHRIVFQSSCQTSSWKSRFRELANFVFDLQPSTKDMLWSFSDPVAAFLELKSTVQELAVNDVKGLIRKILPQRLMHHIHVSRQLGGSTGWLYLKLQLLRSFGIRKSRLPRIPNGVSSVLFICHGNIIRSPFAAALLKGYLSNLRRSGIHISSAGLHAKQGILADFRAIVAAGERGISLEDHRAQPLSSDLVRQADLIFVMDGMNEARFLSKFPQARRKLFLLGAFAPGGLPYDEISDPHKGSEQEIRDCFRNMEACVAEAASEIRDMIPQKGSS